jgi:hypothetical protein
MELSPEVVDNPSGLWTSGWQPLAGLWINLWIKGVKPVDKPVDKPVENCGLWISRDLSTTCPQVSKTYPQFSPQAKWSVFGLDKNDLAGYPHIHSPYYY